MSNFVLRHWFEPFTGIAWHQSSTISGCSRRPHHDKGGYAIVKRKATSRRVFRLRRGKHGASHARSATVMQRAPQAERVADQAAGDQAETPNRR